MAKTDHAPVKRCIDHFYSRFVRKWNPPAHAEVWLKEQADGVAPDERTIPKEQMMLPVIHGGKDGNHFKHLVATYGEEPTLRLVEEFFETTDPRVVRSDYTVGALFSLAQHLMLRRAGKPQDNRAIENADAAARATQRRKG